MRALIKVIGIAGTITLIGCSPNSEEAIVEQNSQTEQTETAQQSAVSVPQADSAQTSVVDSQDDIQSSVPAESEALSAETLAMAKQLAESKKAVQSKAVSASAITFAANPSSDSANTVNASDTKTVTTDQKTLENLAQQSKPKQEVKKVEEPTEQVASAQTTQTDPNEPLFTIYGNPQQPGYQIQMAIYQMMRSGVTVNEAVLDVINRVVSENGVISDAVAATAVANDIKLSQDFVLDIAQLTALIDATKKTIVDNPEKLNEIVSLGVALYPMYAQDIITAASLTGEISEDDAVLLAIAAGADPTTITSATAAAAAGGVPALAATPLGSGIGAGGTGGGDTTASTN